MRVLPTAAVMGFLLMTWCAGRGSAAGGGWCSPSEGQSPPLALVTVGYYVNDRARDASACELMVFNAGRRVEPQAAAGSMYWYVRSGSRQSGDQRIVLRCDKYIAATDSGFDLFSGRVSVVLAVFSPPGRVAIGAAGLNPFDGDDYRHNVWGAYSDGRDILKWEWTTLPEAFRKTIKTSQAVVLTDGGGVFHFAIGYR